MHCKYRALHYLFIGLLIVGTDGQRVTITSIIPDQQPFCPGEEVIITCETRGSPTIAWTSDQYIEQGDTNRLEFGLFNVVGNMTRSAINSDTIATLINKSNENREQVLVSQLRIITLANFSTALITCLNAGGEMNSTTVQVLGIPDMPQNIKANQRIDTEGCIILIEWDPPANLADDGVAYYWIQVNDSNHVNETLTLTAHRVCTCASHIIIRVSVVNYCECEGPIASSLILLNQDPTLLLNSDLQCDAPTTQSGSIQPCPNDSSDQIATGLSLGVILPLLVIIVILSIILAITCYLQRIKGEWSDFLQKIKCC